MFSSSFTGIGRYVYELTRHLFILDDDHEYVLFMNSPQFEKLVLPEVLARDGKPRFKKVLVNAHHYSWAEQFKFWRLLQREKLNLMHFTHFNAPLLYRRPSLVTIHDLTLSFFPGNKMRSWFRRAAYHAVLSTVVRRAARILAVSNYTKKDVMHLLKIPPERVEVIYEGVGEEFHPIKDPRRFLALREKYRLRGDFLLYTGVWRSHKNVVNLLRAFAVLCADPGFHGALVMTGREDPFYPEVKQTVKDLRLESRVHFVGLVPEGDLVMFYNAARVFVMPSFYEGFGLPPLEAMACGTPVACSNASSLPEVCGRDNAVYFNPHSVEQMAEAIRAAWDDEELRHVLRDRGLKHARGFSWKAMAEATLKLYNSVYAKPRS